MFLSVIVHLPSTVTHFIFRKMAFKVTPSYFVDSDR
jgi:hypothetical protein